MKLLTDIKLSMKMITKKEGKLMFYQMINPERVKNYLLMYDSVRANLPDKFKG